MIVFPPKVLFDPSASAPLPVLVRLAPPVSLIRPLTVREPPVSTKIVWLPFRVSGRLMVWALGERSLSWPPKPTLLPFRVKLAAEAVKVPPLMERLGRSLLVTRTGGEPSNQR